MDDADDDEERPMSSEEHVESEGGAADELERVRERYEQTRQRVLLVGYVVMFLVGFAIFIPMVVGAVQGVRTDQIWDSFTGEEITADDHAVDCRQEAGDLIFLAGQYEELDGRWERRYRLWTERCQQDHQDLYHVLVGTRDRLRGAEEPPEMDDQGVENN